MREQNCLTSETTAVVPDIMSRRETKTKLEDIYVPSGHRVRLAGKTVLEDSGVVVFPIKAF